MLFLRGGPVEKGEVAATGHRALRCPTPHVPLITSRVHRHIRTAGLFSDLFSPPLQVQPELVQPSLQLAQVLVVLWNDQLQ